MYSVSGCRYPCGHGAHPRHTGAMTHARTDDTPAPAQTPDHTYDVVVIGAGPVGENVADRARAGRPERRDRRERAGRRRMLVLGVHAQQGPAPPGPRPGRRPQTARTGADDGGPARHPCRPRPPGQLRLGLEGRRPGGMGRLHRHRPVPGTRPPRRGTPGHRDRRRRPGHHPRRPARRRPVHRHPGRPPRSARHGRRQPLDQPRGHQRRGGARAARRRRRRGGRRRDGHRLAGPGRAGHPAGPGRGAARRDGAVHAANWSPRACAPPGPTSAPASPSRPWTATPPASPSPSTTAPPSRRTRSSSPPAAHPAPATSASTRWA